MIAFSSPNENDGCIESLATPVISANARKLRRRPEFRCFDLDDLNQEFWTCLLEALRSYDSRTGRLKGFIEAVVDRHRISMIRTWNCAKRDSAREAFSLYEETTENGQCREATFLHKDSERRRLLHQHIHDSLLDAPDHLREAAPAFAHETVTSIAKARRITKDKVRYYREALRIRLSNG